MQLKLSLVSQVPGFSDWRLIYPSFHIVLAVMLAHDRESLILSNNRIALLVNLFVLAETGTEITGRVNRAILFLTRVFLHVIH